MCCLEQWQCVGALEIFRGVLEGWLLGVEKLDHITPCTVSASGCFPPLPFLHFFPLALTLNPTKHKEEDPSLLHVVCLSECTALPTCDNAVTFDPLIGIFNKEKLGRQKVTGLAFKRKRSTYVRSSRKLQRTEEVGEKTTGEEKMLDGKFLSWLLENLTVGTKSYIRHFILMKERLKRLHKRSLM